jgi:hypothetical protein
VFTVIFMFDSGLFWFDLNESAITKGYGTSAFVGWVVDPEDGGDDLVKVLQGPMPEADPCELLNDCPF